MEKFEKKWQERFERYASTHDEEHLISGWSYDGLCRRLKVFKEIMQGLNIPARSLTLDVGCGVGSYVRFLSEYGCQVIGVDYSLKSLSRAGRNETKNNSRYIGGEAYSLPFRSKYFDVVVSIGVLQSLQYPEKAMKEMVRVLKDNGTLIISFLNSYEIVTFIKSILEKLNGTQPRVHTYSSSEIHQWLTQQNIQVIKRSGVYLLPQQLNHIGKILDSGLVIKTLDTIPVLSTFCAHAFLIAGRKYN